MCPRYMVLESKYAMSYTEDIQTFHVCWSCLTQCLVAVGQQIALLISMIADSRVHFPRNRLLPVMYILIDNSSTCCLGDVCNDMST